MRFPSTMSVAVQRAGTATHASREGPGTGGASAPAGISSAASFMAVQDGAASVVSKAAVDAGKTVPAMQEETGNKVPNSLQKAEQEANRKIAGGPTEIEVDRDESTGRFVLRVLDKATGTVLRQFPPETTLRVSERLSELSGMLFADDA